MAIELQYTLDDGTSDIVLGTVPDGWADFEYILQRSKDLQSVSKNYSESVLRFQNRPYGLFNPNTEQYNPFLFIKRAYDMDGTDAEINLKIHLRNHLTGAYDLLMLDAQLSWNDDPSFDKDYFELTVVENSIMAKYIARDDVLINPNSGKNLDGNAITALVPDDIRIFKEDLVFVAKGTGTWTGGNIDYVDLPAIVPIQSADYEYNTLSQRFKLDGSDVTYINNTDFTTKTRFYISPSTFIPTYVININTTGTVFNVVMSSYVKFNKYNSDGGLIYTVELGGSSQSFQNVGTPYIQSFPYSFNGTNIEIEMLPGESIKFYASMDMEANGAKNDESAAIAEGSISFNITEVSIAETDERAAFSYFPYPLASKLLEAATGNGTLEAPIFQRTEDGALGDGEYSLTSVLSGYMSRGFPISEQPQAFKLKELISSFFGVKNTGIWFDGTKWIWDKLDRFYQDVEILDVGEVSKFKTIASSDYHYNEVVGGAANKVELGDLNGLEDSGTKTNWTTPIKHIKGKYDITSDYEISGNIIEITSRKTYETTAAEDTKYDKNTCLLQCRRDETGLRSDDGTDFSLIENVFDPENKKNLKITSARNAYNHIQEIASVYWKKTNAELSFADAQINSDMRTRIGVDDPIIQENSGIPQSDLGNPLWIPEVMTGECGGIGYDELAKLKANPHGFITGTYRGERFFGFILEFPVNIKEGISNFKLLKKYGGYPPTNIYSDTYSNKYD